MRVTRATTRWKGSCAAHARRTNEFGIWNSEFGIRNSNVQFGYRNDEHVMSMRQQRRLSEAIVVLATMLLFVVSSSARTPMSTIVITGGTVIDGNGGPPLANAAVVVSDGRISAVGPRGTVTIPAGATEIDARGRFILPGLIDTNVHLSLYGGQNER